jgi:hypothetical protein
MSLFSRRFWSALVRHDRRLVAASRGYEQAASRYRTSRACTTGDAQLEFQIEFLEAVRELRDAVGELRAFQDRHPGREPS